MVTQTDFRIVSSGPSNFITCYSCTPDALHSAVLNGTVRPYELLLIHLRDDSSQLGYLNRIDGTMEGRCVQIYIRPYDSAFIDSLTLAAAAILKITILNKPV